MHSSEVSPLVPALLLAVLGGAMVLSGSSGDYWRHLRVKSPPVAAGGHLRRSGSLSGPSTAAAAVHVVSQSQSLQLHQLRLSGIDFAGVPIGAARGNFTTCEAVRNGVGGG